MSLSTLVRQGLTLTGALFARNSPRVTPDALASLEGTTGTITGTISYTADYAIGESHTRRRYPGLEWKNFANYLLTCVPGICEDNVRRLSVAWIYSRRDNIPASVTYLLRDGSTASITRQEIQQYAERVDTAMQDRLASFVNDLVHDMGEDRPYAATRQLTNVRVEEADFTIQVD